MVELLFQESVVLIDNKYYVISLVDYFLWSHMKSKVYRNRSDRKAEIINVTGEINPQLRQNVFTNFVY